MMTRMLQLLLVAAALAGLVIYGFIRYKREHSPAKPKEGTLAPHSQERMLGDPTFKTAQEVGPKDLRRRTHRVV